jgi:hypothetical protein
MTAADRFGARYAEQHEAACGQRGESNVTQ